MDANKQCVLLTHENFYQKISSGSTCMNFKSWDAPKHDVHQFCFTTERKGKFDPNSAGDYTNLLVTRQLTRY